MGSGNHAGRQIAQADASLRSLDNGYCPLASGAMTQRLRPFPAASTVQAQRQGPSLKVPKGADLATRGCYSLEAPRAVPILEVFLRGVPPALDGAADPLGCR